MTRPPSQKLIALVGTFLVAGLVSGPALAHDSGGRDDAGPLVIKRQGSFMAGGTVVTTPGVFTLIEFDERRPDT